MGPSEKPFGELVKEIRIKRDLTQRNLAGVLGVTAAHISNVEKGGNASEAFKKLFFEKMEIQEPQTGDVSEAQTSHFAARVMLLDEIKAASEVLEHPLSEAEMAVCASAENDQLLEESAMLREALELRTKRELLAAAKASCQRWEAKAHGK